MLKYFTTVELYIDKNHYPNNNKQTMMTHRVSIIR